MKKVYLIGIKGVGMSALAIYLKQANYDVAGSDQGVFLTDELLKENNIKFFDEFSSQNVETINPDWVIVSAAYDKENIEYISAKNKGLKISYYSEALAQITEDVDLIAVSGVHGKTTTTAMVAHLFEEADLSPSYLIGTSKVSNLGSNAKKGQGKYFVLEADEYRKSPDDNHSKFLDLNPKWMVVSSIELDHPDIFKDEEAVYEAFREFSQRIKPDGKIVLCLDYQRIKQLSKEIDPLKLETYGFSSEAKWQIIDVRNSAKETIFKLTKDNVFFGEFSLFVPGEHNILNAVAAIIIGSLANIPVETIKAALLKFCGTPRRFEIVFSGNEIVLIDDYAHHPTAIRKTLRTVKERYPSYKLVSIFQPHTYSRTKALLGEFSQAFTDADEVIIMDIFASAREKNGTVNTEILVKEIKKNHRNVFYFDSLDKIQKHLLKEIKTPEAILTIGAGDIYKLAQSIKKDLELKYGRFN